jgi:hypothetical protein
MTEKRRAWLCLGCGGWLLAPEGEEPKQCCGPLKPIPIPPVETHGRNGVPKP